jgi:putative heme iron utilization protein
MESRLDVLIDLLHRCTDGALATHSVAMPGYPFATALPFATDDRHRPVFLISRLAEHTQNLAADARASLMVRRLLPEGEMARTTLAGRVEPITAEPLLVERYLRYQPEAERLLQFGDFAFFRLEPVKIRIIGGFAQAGWLEGERLAVPPRLTFAQERTLLDALKVPPGVEVLGIDGYGVDLRRIDGRQRVAFAEAAETADALRAASQAAIDALAED